MTPADIQILIDHLDVVRSRAEACLSKAQTDGTAVLRRGCRETGALKRSTLDLEEATRAVRRPHQDDESMDDVPVGLEEDNQVEDGVELSTVTANPVVAACVICQAPISRKGRGNGRRVTCGPECAAQRDLERAVVRAQRAATRRRVEVAA